MSTLPSLGPQFDSARAKLHRANKQIQAFKKSMQRFGMRDIYENRAKAYDPGLGFLPSRQVHIPAQARMTPMGVQYIEPARTQTFFSKIALTISVTPKTDFSAQYFRWGIVIGEIVHNIGSALDNLVWELAQPLPPPPPPTANYKARDGYRGKLSQIGFPYTKERKDWLGHCNRYLHFVTDPAARAVLEETQAFYAWENTGADADTFPLQVLRELWNRDKHRTINVATTGLQIQVSRVRMPDLFPNSGYLPSQVIKTFPMRPIIGETEIAVIGVDLPVEIEFPQSGQLELTVNVHPQFALAILFGDGSPAVGENAIDVLQRAHQLASELVEKFR